MRAISLWQPWASLVGLGIKHYETRHWATPYRGELVIHAAKHWDVSSAIIFSEEPFCSAFKGFGITNRSQLPFGAAICFAELVDVIPTEVAVKSWLISADELKYGNYSKGRYAWKLANIQMFDAPVPYKGSQGFFNYDYAKRIR